MTTCHLQLHAVDSQESWGSQLVICSIIHQWFLKMMILFYPSKRQYQSIYSCFNSFIIMRSQCYLMSANVTRVNGQLADSRAFGDNRGPLSGPFKRVELQKALGNHLSWKESTSGGSGSH